MKVPDWVLAEFTQHSEQGTDRRIVVRQVADRLVTTDAGLVRRLADSFVRAEYDRWTRRQEAAASLLDGDGQLVMVFPDVPAHLEVAPGRFAHQSVMTGPDWDAALRQAETKASNANGFADTVRRAYDRVRPLLTEDTLTTAQVAGLLAAVPAEATA